MYSLASLASLASQLIHHTRQTTSLPDLCYFHTGRHEPDFYRHMLPGPVGSNQCGCGCGYGCGFLPDRRFPDILYPGYLTTHQPVCKHPPASLLPYLEMDFFYIRHTRCAGNHIRDTSPLTNPCGKIHLLGTWYLVPGTWHIS
jgi:hypothetical protein